MPPARCIRFKSPSGAVRNTSSRILTSNPALNHIPKTARKILDGTCPRDLRHPIMWHELFELCPTHISFDRFLPEHLYPAKPRTARRPSRADIPHPWLPGLHSQPTEDVLYQEAFGTHWQVMDAEKGLRHTELKAHQTTYVVLFNFVPPTLPLNPTPRRYPTHRVLQAAYARHSSPRSPTPFMQP